MANMHKLVSEVRVMGSTTSAKTATKAFWAAAAVRMGEPTGESTKPQNNRNEKKVKVRYHIKHAHGQALVQRVDHEVFTVKNDFLEMRF
jgi:hypothetical protein